MSDPTIRFVPPKLEAGPASALLDRLHAKIEHALNHVVQTDLWRTLSSPESDAKTVATVLKYLMLESFSFTPHAVRSIMHAISNFPHSHHNLCNLAAHTIIDEIPHSELALRDFVALGGDEHWARSRRMTHESFIVSATMHMLCEHESPFAYLGLMYFFESLTRELSPRGRAFLEAKGVGRTVRKFVEVHAVDDIEHVREVANVIQKAVAAFPEVESAIEYGMDVTAKIYPVPLWEQVMRHVRAELCSETVE